MCMPIVPYWLQWLSLAFLGTSPLPDPTASPFLTASLPVGWSPLQGRHADVVPRQGLAEREEAVGGAHPLPAQRQLHVPATTLPALHRRPGREDSSPPQGPVRYKAVTAAGWGGPSEPVGGSKLPLVLRKVLRGLDVWNGFAKPPPQIAKMMLKGLLLSSEFGGGTGSRWPGWSCPGMVTVNKTQASSILPRLIVVQEQKSQQNNISLCPFYFFAAVPAVEVLEALYGNICERRENGVSKCL